MSMFSKRTWGFYLTLFSGKQFRVKLLWFREGKHLSMQTHSHRNELWLYVFGRGQMYLNRNMSVSEMRHSGEYSYIERNQWHQFFADKNTLVIEVQHGAMCKESDIIRA